MPKQRRNPMEREDTAKFRAGNGQTSWGVGKWGSGYGRTSNLGHESYGTNDVREILGGRDHTPVKKIKKGPKRTLHPVCDGLAGKKARVCMNSLNAAQRAQMQTQDFHETAPGQELRGAQAEMIATRVDMPEDCLAGEARPKHAKNTRPLGTAHALGGAPLRFEYQERYPLSANKV
jgi:hypothetical protein